MSETPKRDNIDFPNIGDLRLTEDHMALEFAEVEQDRRRYVAEWGRWMSYRDGIWSEDKTFETYDAIRPIVRARSSAVLSSSKAVARALKLSSAATVAGVEKLARADRRLAATGEQWDANPMSLGIPGGIIDLSSGEIREAIPEDYLTRSAGSAPDGNMPTPIWNAFLDFVTEGDPEYASFLQRMSGYCLTGSTIEQTLFFIFGHGANGKSVFVKILSFLLAGYSKAAVTETFVDTGQSKHTTDIAMLRGARLVTAQETEQGRRWNEARLKQLTGGDEITARLMRQDNFTYTPQFKLLISGNHKPSLKSVDEAIRRRMRLLPFARKVPEEQRDLHLFDKLVAEAPGILAWMIEGCVAWQEHGLGSCKAVDTATNDYLSEEDALGNWISDCCIVDVARFASSADLFASWTGWAEAANEFVGNKKSLGQALQKRGFERDRDGQVRGYRGITVKKGGLR